MRNSDKFRYIVDAGNNLDYMMRAETPAKKSRNPARAWKLYDIGDGVAICTGSCSFGNATAKDGFMKWFDGTAYNLPANGLSALIREFKKYYIEVK